MFFTPNRAEPQPVLILQVGIVEIPDQARQSSFPFARFPLHLPPSGEPTGLQTSRLNCIEQAQNKAKLPY